METGGTLFFCIGDEYMFITVQMPFVDFRLLDKNPSKNYFYPNFFMQKGTANKTYYRFLGSRAARTQSLNLPLSEKEFFDSTNSLKLKIAENNYNASIIFSRLYCDRFFFHFDFGIKIESEKVKNKDILKVVNDIFSAIYTNDRRPDIKNPIINFPDIKQYLIAIYRYATTYTNAEISDDENKMLDSKILFGKLGVFINCNKSDIISESFHPVFPNDTEYKIYVCSSCIKQIQSDIWIIDKPDIPQIRELRICLSKLHCFKECLFLTTKYLDNFKDDSLLNIADISQQFEFINRLYKKDSYYGFKIESIESAAFSANLSADVVTWDDYKNKIDELLKRFRPLSSGAAPPET